MEKELQQKLNLVRSAERITGRNLIDELFTDVLELHGDRINNDDAAIFTGIGRLNQQPVTLMSIDRGQTVAERLAQNGGAVRASGYRKALRSLKLAERFNRPVISFLNLPGADASVASENEGQSLMIANLIAAMGQAMVPNLAIFIGEGHSGGALAFANANQIWMLENSLFSVASPEAMSAILRDDQALSRVPMTAKQLKQIGIADLVLAENADLIEKIRTSLVKWLATSAKMNKNEMIEQREQKFQRVLDSWNQSAK
jgi:acetyl-CoA carboxylase carboxyl transferase subunit alpha